MARIVFFGTGDFAVPSLKAVAEQVLLVVTQPDRPSGRGLKLQPSPVKQAAVELGIPVATPEKAREAEFVERVRAVDADFLLVASYGQILSTALLESAKYGGINLHGSILPKYRGAAPIQRCILEGESETGVTLMQMDKGMDTGDIIALEFTPIPEDECYGSLQERLGTIAARMIAGWVDAIALGKYPRVAQKNESSTTAPKISKAEAILEFERPADQEFRRFRAFTPNPGAILETSCGLLRIASCRYSVETGTPGTVLKLRPLTIAFNQGSIELSEIQPAGKKRMSGNDFANGARIRVGDSLRISS